MHPSPVPDLWHILKEGVSCYQIVCPGAWHLQSIFAFEVLFAGIFFHRLIFLFPNLNYLISSEDKIIYHFASKICTPHWLGKLSWVRAEVLPPSETGRAHCNHGQTLLCAALWPGHSQEHSHLIRKCRKEEENKQQNKTWILSSL